MSSEKRASLPLDLIYKTANDLVRIGRDNDGGYLVVNKDLKNAKKLLTFGINDDLSFEKQFSEINDVPVVAYDGSISRNIFLKQLLKSFIRLDNPRVFLHWLSVVYDYMRYFRKNNHAHIQKFVGPRTDSSDFIDFSEALEENLSDNSFLKIDIEGFEYRLLSDILKNQDQILSLVIEFHDFDLNYERVIEFTKKFNLKIVHVHVNNCAPVRADNLLPMVVEITYSRTSCLLEQAVSPHSLDLPNDPKKSDYQIYFTKL